MQPPVVSLGRCTAHRVTIILPRCTGGLYRFTPEFCLQVVEGWPCLLDVVRCAGGAQRADAGLWFLVRALGWRVHALLEFGAWAAGFKDLELKVRGRCFWGYGDAGVRAEVVGVWGCRGDWCSSSSKALRSKMIRTSQIRQCWTFAAGAYLQLTSTQMFIQFLACVRANLRILLHVSARMIAL